jgi:hypothetical protein
MDRKKSISAIISVVLLILVTAVLVAGFLSWSKTSVREKLDVSQGELQEVSRMDCIKYNLVVESCNLDSTTGNIEVLLRNPTPIDFYDLSLNIQGTSQNSSNILKMHGNFDNPILSGEIKKLKTTTDFTIVNSDINIASGEIIDPLDLKVFTLSNSTCPKKTIDLKKCAVELPSSQIFFSNITNFDPFRVNTSVSFETDTLYQRGSVSCEWYHTIAGGEQVRMNPLDTLCDIDYTFTTAGTYEILVVANDDEGTFSDDLFVEIFDDFSSTILNPTEESNYNVTKTINFNSSYSNNVGNVTCNWSHKRADLPSFTSFSTDCNTSYSFSVFNDYSIKLDTLDDFDSSSDSQTIGINILDLLSSSITMSRTTWNNNETISFTGNYDNNVSTVSCEWILDSGDVNTTVGTNCASLSQTLSSTGSYTIYYKVTDSGTGDIATSSEDFTVVLPLTATINSPDASDVYNLSEGIYFDVSVSNAIGTKSYQWQYRRNGIDPWVTFSTSSSASVGFATGGTYEFRVLVTDSSRPSPINQVYSNTVADILVANALAVSISDPTIGTGYFTNADINFVASVSNAVNGVSSYSWEYSTGGSWINFGTGGSSEVFSFSTTGTKYIRVTVIDGASRSATSSEVYNVVISTPVTPNLTNIVLSNSPSYFNFSGSTYTYNGVLYLTGRTTNTSITVTPTGSGTITVNGSTVASGTASSPISISDGNEKTITVVATVSGAPSKTYTIKVRKVVTSGGTITEGVTSGVAWRVHRFTSGGTFATNMALTAKLLVVGGGGGGGPYNGAGGDGGQYRYFSSQAISSGNSTVTIGAGGYTNTAGWPRTKVSGTDSSFGSISSTGGVTGTEGYGFGYGGANGVGTAGASSAAGGAGAAGISNSITGSSIAYTKGGNGNSTFTSGTANTGNGGNGYPEMPGPTYGGTGVVVVRLEMPV